MGSDARLWREFRFARVQAEAVRRVCLNRVAEDDMKGANVFWISIDSLRRDFLHAYNPALMRSTYLDELAQTGCVFENAFPGGNWTMPSHASMLTGQDTTSHMIWSWQHR